MSRAIIIADHGSRREEAKRMLDALADQLRAQSDARVYAAHMEIVEPTIAQAFDAAVADGADFVFIFPCFLTPGRHSREDIPKLCAEAAARHPDIRYHCSGPVGLDPLLAQLILNRVQHCERNGWTCIDCPDAGICGQSESAC
jgi:sirohydrochlorin ferrochelatase